MDTRLQQIEEKYDELTARMTDPTLYQDHERYLQIARTQ